VNESRAAAALTRFPRVAAGRLSLWISRLLSNWAHHPSAFVRWLRALTATRSGFRSLRGQNRWMEQPTHGRSSCGRRSDHSRDRSGFGWFALSTILRICASSGSNSMAARTQTGRLTSDCAPRAIRPISPWNSITEVVLVVAWSNGCSPRRSRSLVRDCVLCWTMTPPLRSLRR